MGSWSETCFASHLPIHEGGCRIVGIPVVATGSHRNAARVVESEYVPVGPPVRGEYDIYGGIEVDPEDEILLEPLREEARRVSATLSYNTLDSFRGSLRGIGLSKYHDELFLGKPLPPEEIGDYEGASTTRQWCMIGDSAWLHFPASVLEEDEPSGEMKAYPVMWCFMLEEVYDHMLSLPYGEGFYRQTKDSIRTSVTKFFEHFTDPDRPDITEIEWARKTVQSEDFASLDEETRNKAAQLILMDVDLLLYSNFFGRWAEDMCRVTSFRHTGIYSYCKPGAKVTEYTHERFFELMHVIHSMQTLRILLHRSGGPQFGHYQKHHDFHALCKKIAQDYMDSEAEPGEPYEDPCW